MRHRMEVLHHGRNDRREYWIDRAERVRLVRRLDEAAWTAMVDRQTVLDDAVAASGDGTVERRALRGPSAAVLAASLSRRGIHIVFDVEEEWQQDITGWPVRLVRRPPRPADRVHQGS